MIYRPIKTEHRKQRGRTAPNRALSTNMVYGIKDKIPFGKQLLFAVQMLLSVFVASALIANICGVDVGAALIGAGLSTLIYSFVVKGESPMFISNSGNFVAPVLMALAACGYNGVVVGGLVTCIVYCLFGIAFTKISYEKIYKVFPPALIGAVTVVIGINLMAFIPSYIGATEQWGVIIALFTMLVTGLVSHHAKGIAKILPFLIGILSGYAVATVLTLTNVVNLIDFSVFNDLSIINIPKFAFMKTSILAKGAPAITGLASIVIVYIAYTVSAMMECLSDHAALGGIIGKDLYKEPGLGRIFIGEGLANLASSTFGGLGACSYGEGVACVGFSKVASIKVVRTAAIMLAALGFIGPVQAFIASIPACVFAGAAIILYGFIAASGIRMLQKTDFNIQKNLIITSVVLSLGISGIAVGNDTIFLSATALALVVGVILNLILKENNGK